MSVKILKSSEWEPIFWASKFPGIEGPVYLFKHKRWEDITALKAAKYIDVTADIVYYFDADAETVSVSRSKDDVPDYTETHAEIPRVKISV